MAGISNPVKTMFLKIILKSFALSSISKITSSFEKLSPLNMTLILQKLNGYRLSCHWNSEYILKKFNRNQLYHRKMSLFFHENKPQFGPRGV